MWKPLANLNHVDKQKLIAKGKKIGLKASRMPIVWAAALGIVVAIAVHYPGWERKSDLYDVIKSGRTGTLCLSHENSVFERSSMSRSYATTKRYVRFDRETFIHDFLNRDDFSMTYLAVIIDMDGAVHWSEMTRQENQDLSRRFKTDLGTCLSANGIHYQIPGASIVTNQ